MPKDKLETYVDLLKELNDKATALKTDINDKWKEYLPSYPEILEGVDAWLKLLDDNWLATAHSTTAQNRLIASKLMKKKGKQYAANRLPWLRNEALLSSIDSHEDMVIKSASLIVEHATRRVDFYFITLLFFYNKFATVTLTETNRSLQYVHGVRKYKTEASHSAIISNFQALKVTGEILDTGPHLIKTLNTTVELPAIVNDFDGALEGKIKLHSRWRKKSLQILHDVSGEADEPRSALVKFLINLLDFFLDKNTVSKYWSNTSSVEKKLIYIFQSVGTFYFLWSKSYNLNNYINSMLRINNNEEAQKFQEKKFFRVNKYKMFSDEIAGITANSSWINQFFAIDLTNEAQKNTLREDDFTRDILDNLLCYPETFDAAMTLLIDLVDEDDALNTDFDSCYHSCPILYEITTAFSPLLGGISYEQRLKYLEYHLITADNAQKIIRSQILVKALYRCIQTIAWRDIPEYFGSKIYSEDTKIIWDYPQVDNDKDDPAIEKYCFAFAKLIIKAGLQSDNADLCSDIISMVDIYLDNNLGNFLGEYATRRLINLFLISLPIYDENNFDCKGIDVSKIRKIFIKFQNNDFSILRDDITSNEIELFKDRINEFYLSMAINLHRAFLNKYDLTNNKDLSTWYFHFTNDDDTDVETIIYLYDFFNGNGAWTEDVQQVNNLAKLTSIQIKQLIDKIENIKCNVNNFYLEITESGIVPAIKLTEKIGVLNIILPEKAINFSNAELIMKNRNKDLSEKLSDTLKIEDMKSEIVDLDDNKPKLII